MTEQVAGYAGARPELAVKVQASDTEPEKPAWEFIVTILVLPLLAPELIGGIEATFIVNGVASMAVMHGLASEPHVADAESEAPAVVPVPVTIRLRTPFVPGLELRATVLTAVFPAMRVTGDAVQVP